MKWKAVEGIWNGTVFAQHVGALHCQKRRAKAVLADAETEKQEGIQGKWQMESPFREVLEQIKKSSDVSCNAYLVRRAHYAGKSGDWEGCQKAHRDKGESSEWACIKVEESYDEVAWEDVGRLSIAQDILRKHTHL